MSSRISQNHNEYICPICYSNESESPEDYFVSAACGHIFHLECILQMLQREMTRCPMNCSEEITEDSLRRIFGVPMSSTSTIPNNATGGQNQSDPSIDYTFKVILLGQGGVGKTCVLCRYSDNSFFEWRISTIGVDIRFKSVTIGNSTVQLSIWDTGGQETFRSIYPAFVRDVQGIIFVYDITCKESFDDIKFWTEFASQYGPEDCVKIMIGNKCDQAANREVDTALARRVAESQNMPFFETSAKEDINCEAVFRSVAAAILQNARILATLPRSRDDLIRINKAPTTKSKKKCCGIL